MGAKKFIELLDRERFDDKVSRLEFFEQFQNLALDSLLETYRGTDGRVMWYNAIPSIRCSHYVEEAIFSYLMRNLLSCIFCCASAIENAFRYEFIENAEDSKEAFKDIENGYITFGSYIPVLKKSEKCNKSLKGLLNNTISERLTPFVDDADWLNTARNTVGVHPPFIAHSDFIGEMIKIDLEQLSLLILGTNIPKFKVGKKGANGNDLWIGIDEIIKEPNQPEALRIWNANEPIILEQISQDALKKMFHILDGLYLD